MISEKDFEKILARYLNGTATETEIHWVEKWYAILEDERSYSSLDDEQKKAIKTLALLDVQKNIRLKKNGRMILWSSLSAAASVLVILLSILYNNDREASPVSVVQTDVSTQQVEIIANESTEIKLITLSDMTQITLQPNSVIEVAPHYDGKDRRVRLKGEAFFQVAHNPEKPFYVATEQMVTKVLGTSFNIVARNGEKQIVVSVKTGKVAVFKDEKDKQEPEQKVLLTPNHQAIIDKATYVVSTRIVDSPQAVQSPVAVERTHFSNTPVSQVLEALKKIYNVNVDFNSEVLEKCLITTSLPAGDFYKKLDVICDAIGATYTVEGLTIKIQSNGCN